MSESPVLENFDIVIAKPHLPAYENLWMGAQSSTSEWNIKGCCSGAEFRSRWNWQDYDTFKVPYL